MDYQTQEQAQTLVREFQRKGTLINVIYFLIAGLVLYGAFVVPNPLAFSPLFLIIILVSGIGRSFARQFLYVPLNATLYQDCDPETYHAAYLALLQWERHPVYRRACVLGIANGIYYMGDHEGAIRYLEHNFDSNSANFSQWLSAQNILANCYACRPDLKSLHTLEKDLSSCRGQRLKKGERMGLESCIQIVGIYITLYSGDYEPARKACEERLEISSLTFQRIGLHYRLGYIAAMQGEAEEARKQLGIVLQKGGGLCFVNKARALLQEVDEYPFPEGAPIDLADPQ